MIKLKEIFIEKNNLIIPVIMLFIITQKHHNEYVEFAFFGLMLLYVFFKFQYLHKQDKENNTKEIQKTLIIMLIIIIVLPVFYLLAEYVFFKKPF